MRRQPWMPWSPSSPKKRRSSLVADYVKLDGVVASEGVAVGPAFVHVPHELKPERESISEDAVEDELKRFKNAVEAVVREISETAERLREGGSESEAGIFEAHAEMAEDPEFQDGVEERVRNLESPEAAVISVGEEFAGMFAAMDDEYMAARADDVRDVAAQIASELMGGGHSGRGRGGGRPRRRLRRRGRRHRRHGGLRGRRPRGRRDLGLRAERARRRRRSRGPRGVQARRGPNQRRQAHR